MRNKLLKMIIKSDTVVKDLNEKIVKGMPYKIPKRFPKWEIITSLIAVEIAIAITPKRFIMLETDVCSEVFAYSCTIWFIKNGPVYLLSSELQRGLLNSQINSSVIKDLKPVVPAMLVLLEEKIDTPSGKIDSLFINLISKENPEWTSGTREGLKIPAKKVNYDYVLTWSGMDTKTTIWSQSTGINETGEIVSNLNESIGSDEFTDSDRQLLIKIQNLVFQILSVLQYEPEMLEDCVVTELSGNGKGFGKGKVSTKANYLLPRWIGKNYRVKTQDNANKSSSEVSKNEVSKSNQWHVQGFWVQGHYQRYYIGSKDNAQVVWKRKEPIYKQVK